MKGAKNLISLSFLKREKCRGNSLLLKFFRYVTWFDQRRSRRPCKQGSIEENSRRFIVKGTTKFYYIYHSRVVIIFLSVGLYKSVFSTNSYVNLGFCLSVFWFIMFLYLSLFIFLVMF